MSKSKSKSKYKAIKINGVKRDYHRWLMEQELGRELDPDEIVHHKNEDKMDNDISNLEVMTRSKHGKLHAKPPYFSDYARERSREYLTSRPAPTRKLSDEDAKFIKANYIPRNSEYGARALGRRFGVSHQVILGIVKGEYYKES